jgi:hypothetical protein
METSMIVVLVAGVVFLMASAVAWVVIRNKRSKRLKSRFGTEYERAVTASGSRIRAEADLTSRTKRVERFDIHPLSAADHDRFAERWLSTQASFVDSPAGAVSAAETLVEEVMRARGYPVGDFDQRAADMSVDHPRFVANYREARELSLANQRGSAKTEDLRQATVHYRALFEDLLDTTDRREIEVRG